MKKYSGFLAAIVCSIMVGLTPIIAKSAYEDGQTAMSLAFWRSFLSLPILYVFFKLKKQSLHITKKEALALLIAGFPGSAFTTLFMYSSYNYVSAGVATALHFLYPALVTLAGVLLYKEKASVKVVLSVVLGFLGVLLLADFSGTQNMLGVLLSVFSAVCMAVYMLCIQHSVLKNMSGFTLAFYLALTTMVSSGVMGLIQGDFVLVTSINAWFFTGVLAITNSILLTVLTSYAIVRIGASSTSLLSVLTPLTSAVLGVLVLHESLSYATIAGVFLMLGSMALTMLPKGRGISLQEKGQGNRQD